MSDKLSAKLVFSAVQCFLKRLDQDAGRDRIRLEWIIGLISSMATSVLKRVTLLADLRSPMN